MRGKTRMRLDRRLAELRRRREANGAGHESPPWWRRVWQAIRRLVP